MHAYKFQDKKMGLLKLENINGQIKDRAKEKLSYQWRNAEYWRLPENVRKAVDNAKSKSNISDFER